MNSKQVGNRLGVLALTITIVLLLIAAFSAKSYSYKPNRIKITNPYPCVKNGVEWIKVDKFALQDFYHVCGYVSSQNPNLKAQIDIRLYKNRITHQKDAIFYDVEWIHNGDVSIPLDVYLDPGTYVVHIADGRLALAEIEFQVVEK